MINEINSTKVIHVYKERDVAVGALHAGIMNDC